MKVADGQRLFPEDEFSGLDRSRGRQDSAFDFDLRYFVGKTFSGVNVTVKNLEDIVIMYISNS
jgi:hypothetical protein